MNIDDYRSANRWMHEKRPRMPEMVFPAGMTVQPVIPFGGATCRFMLNGYSVYLDHFDELGCVRRPYWEAYDGDDCHRFMLDDWQEMIDEIMRWEKRT